MSNLVLQKLQLGQSATATNNFDFYTKGDGKVYLGNGNLASPTDLLYVDGQGNIVNAITGKPIGIIQSSAVVTVASAATTAPLTGIPAWAKRITLSINALVSATSGIIALQLGTSAGYVNTGYNGLASGPTGGATNNYSNSNTNLPIIHIATTASNTGIVTLTLMDASANRWAMSGNMINGTYISSSAGMIALPGTLDRLQLTTSTTFYGGSTGGTFSVLYEG